MRKHDPRNKQLGLVITGRSRCPEIHHYAGEMQYKPNLQRMFSKSINTSISSSNISLFKD